MTFNAASGRCAGHNDKKKFANEEPPNCGGIELSIVKTIRHSTLGVATVLLVCAVTVNTLLRQIVGLTSVAQSRSLAARDILLKMQRHHDRNQREVFGPSVVGSKMGGTPIYQEIPRTLEKILDNLISNMSMSDSETDTHEYAVNDLPYGALKVEAYVADEGKTTAAVPILPDDLLMKSKRRSKSECPMDIVYGHPKDKI
ncbi:hypothetical protein M0R45_035758 [Rubus argutus]|uniref:Uncharacterized protein n=1 Tax=Rubus argutus TaxID=59490 RepID=A0AAW1VXU2_RUBAR